MPKKFFFFDIDGTLTDKSTHKIVPSAEKALQQLKDHGHFAAIATGRARYKALSFTDPINIYDLVCYGGGCLVIDGQTVSLKALDHDKAVRLLEHADADGLGWMLMLHDADDVYFNRPRFLEQAGLRTELTTYHYDHSLDFHALPDILKIYLYLPKGSERRHPWIQEMGFLDRKSVV